MTLSSEHLVYLSRVFFAESDSGVTEKNLLGVTPSKILVAPFSWLKKIDKTRLSEGTPFKITVLSSFGLHKEADSRIIDKV